MPILTILIILVAVCLLLWLINNHIPMDSKIKNMLNGVVIIVVIMWLMKVFGMVSSQSLYTQAG